MFVFRQKAQRVVCMIIVVGAFAYILYGGHVKGILGLLGFLALIIS